MNISAPPAEGAFSRERVMTTQRYEPFCRFARLLDVDYDSGEFTPEQTKERLIEMLATVWKEKEGIPHRAVAGLLMGVWLYKQYQHMKLVADEGDRIIDQL
jgi:hypothetical protein